MATIRVASSSEVLAAMDRASDCWLDFQRAAASFEIAKEIGQSVAATHKQMMERGEAVYDAIDQAEALMRTELADI